MLKKRFLADFERENNIESSRCVAQKAPLSPPTKRPCVSPTMQPTPVKALPSVQPKREVAISPTDDAKRKKENPNSAAHHSFLNRRDLVQDSPDTGGLGADELDDQPRFNAQGERLYCLCHQPYNSRIFMIGCDECDDWFHGRCVGIGAARARSIEHYVCPRCTRRKTKTSSATTPKSSPQQQPVRQQTPNPNRATSSTSPNSQPIKNMSDMPYPSSSSTSLVSEEHNEFVHESDRPDTDSSSPNNSPTIASSPVRSPERHPDDDAKKPSQVSEARNLFSSSLAQLSGKGDDFQSSLCEIDEGADVTVKDASARLNELKEIQAKQSAVLESIQAIGTKRVLLNEAIRRAEQQEGACGCPVGDQYCVLPSTSCFEHMHWAALQRSTLVQEELLQDNLLKRLKTEENLLRLKLASSS